MFPYKYDRDAEIEALTKELYETKKALWARDCTITHCHRVFTGLNTEIDNLETDIHTLQKQKFQLNCTTMELHRTCTKLQTEVEALSSLKRRKQINAELRNKK